jgi:MFS transporter, FHS family, L-fucose permease
MWRMLAAIGGSEHMPKESLRGFYAPAVILTFALFALWGGGHGLYSALVTQFAKVFQLNESTLALTNSFYSIVYFLCAIPAALYARTFGYRAAIIFGLGSLAVGGFLFYQAAEQNAYLFFLFAVSVMSLGWIFLEVCALPLIMRLGQTETCVRRLNFAETLYPVGALVGIYVGRWVILSDLASPIRQLAHAIVQPYIVFSVGVLLLAFLIDKVHFPSVATERAKPGTSAAQEYRTLLSRPRFVFGMVAMFFGIAVQGGTWIHLAGYAGHELPGLAATTAADVLLWYLIVFAVGRFVGAALMYRVDPNRLLAIFSGAGMVLAAIATGVGGYAGLVCLLASGFFVSILFPTIFASTVRDLGPLTKAGSALVFVGGGACGIVLLLTPMLWNVASFRFAMAVPTLSYAVVLAFAVAIHREHYPAAHAVPACAAE